MNILSIICRPREFRRKIEESRHQLYRVAYSWCHDTALADDLVQETLFKALKSSAQLRDDKLLKAWLFSILANCWRDHLRQYRAMDNIDDFEDCLSLDEATPEDERALAQMVTNVRAEIARLPLIQREVLTLVDLEELSYAEVGEILSIPVGTVMSRLCRARRALKERLQPLEMGHGQPKIRSIK